MLFCNAKCQEILDIKVIDKNIKPLELTEMGQKLKEKRFVLTKMKQSDIDNDYSPQLLKDLQELRAKAQQLDTNLKAKSLQNVIQFPQIKEGDCLEAYTMLKIQKDDQKVI